MPITNYLLTLSVLFPFSPFTFTPVIYQSLLQATHLYIYMETLFSLTSVVTAIVSDTEVRLSLLMFTYLTLTLPISSSSYVNRQLDNTVITTIVSYTEFFTH